MDQGDIRSATDSLHEGQAPPTWLEEPPDAAAHVVFTSPQVLPFDQLTPENFERLILRLVRMDSVVAHCQLYGVRGQDQQGIDLYARLHDPGTANDGRRYRTVQCRNVTTMSGKDIIDAVDDFLSGRWASDSATFVIATRASALRTQRADAVEQAAHILRAADMKFEIWDGEELSHRLRQVPELVESFFGGIDAVRLFCPSPVAVEWINGTRHASDNHDERSPADRVDRISQPAHAATTGRGQGPALARTRRFPEAHTASATVSAPVSPAVLAAPVDIVQTLQAWRVTRPGSQTLGLSNGLKEIISPHRRSHYASDSEAPPSVRVGFAVASGPLASSGPTTSLARRTFLALLRSGPIAEFVNSLVPVPPSPGWLNYGDTGRSHYSAILADSDVDGQAPAAWARLLLPTPGAPSFGRDPRCTGFILHIEPPDTLPGSPRVTRNLRWWVQTLETVLAVPAAVAAYLRDELGVELAAEPEPIIGVWLSTPDALTELVTIEGARIVHGTQISRWFDAYAIADAEQTPANAIARAWVTQLCDESLHLDDYEDGF